MRNRNLFHLLAGLFGLCLALAAQAAPPAGKVLFAQGGVQATDAEGRVRKLERGSEVFPGDFLATAEGRMQLRFSDGGMVSLEPYSQFGIDQYQFSGAADGSESLAFRLIKGGFRTVTGAIGSRRGEHYKVDAVVATIGIRGTAYRARLCQGDCREGGRPRPDGLHASVSRGAIFLRNEAGVLDVPAGRDAYVAGIDVAPLLMGPGGGAPPASAMPGADLPEIKPEDQLTPSLEDQHHAPGGCCP